MGVVIRVLKNSPFLTQAADCIKGLALGKSDLALTWTFINLYNSLFQQLFTDRFSNIKTLAWHIKLIITVKNKEQMSSFTF